MLTEKTQNIPATATPFLQQVEVTATDLIVRLMKFTLERREALLFYPNAKGVPDKLAEIDGILYQLDYLIKSDLPVKAIAKLVLKQTIMLHFIAPRDSSKRFSEWYLKIEDVMQAFRDVLGWRAQQ